MNAAFWDAYAALRGRRLPQTAMQPAQEPLIYDARFFREYALTRLLPFWMRYAVDGEYGGFITHLRRDGAPYGKRKVTAMQARMSYAFAAAAQVEPSGAYLEHAAHAAAFMRAHLWEGRHGGWIASSHRDGSPDSTEKRTFHQAYAVIGLAKYCIASHDRDAAEIVRASYDLTKKHLYDGARGGYFLSCAANWKVRSPQKTICSQLDMLLAALMMREMTGEQRYLDDAAELADLILEHMYDAGRHALLETCEVSWAYDAMATRDVVWFGHNFKGAWQLLQLYELTARERYREAALHILDYCIRYGYDAQHGGFFHYCYRSGPLASQEKLWWTNCEAIMALLLADRIGGPRAYSGYVNRTLEFCLHAFSDPAHGEWYRSCAADGRPLDTNKGGGDKAAYHTVQAFLTAAEYLS